MIFQRRFHLSSRIVVHSRNNKYRNKNKKNRFPSVLAQSSFFKNCAANIPPSVAKKTPAKKNLIHVLELLLSFILFSDNFLGITSNPDPRHNYNPEKKNRQWGQNTDVKIALRGKIQNKLEVVWQIQFLWIDKPGVGKPVCLMVPDRQRFSERVTNVTGGEFRQTAIVGELSHKRDFRPFPFRGIISVQLPVFMKALRENKPKGLPGVFHQ